ncbi:hypothetical protein X943_003110 [Babesia divergens]|uniref:Uncharacterized protein n=1 Tax=Babesia divergens TaxID=32595 RepID=A0AAD9GFP1_BABDI|nr:hypothetical protein X943_003110 [Babesia divergens]
MGSAKIIPADAGSDHAIKPCRPYERRREVYKEGSSRSNPYVAEPVAYSKGVAGRGERPHNEDIQAANAAFHGKHLSQPYSQSLNHKTADCEMGISSATNLPDSAVSGTATAQALPIPPLFENFADTWTPYPSFTEIFRLVLHLNRLMHDIVVKKGKDR